MKIIVVFKLKIVVFCYQSCSDLLWEIIVLLIKKNFWNSRLKAENYLCSENRMSWIFWLFFQNVHEWKLDHWNPQEQRPWCPVINFNCNLCFNKIIGSIVLLFTVIVGKFRFQVQDSDFEYFFWWFGDLNNTLHFLEKATFIVPKYSARYPGVYLLIN